MKTVTLTPAQRRLQEIIQALEFGTIQAIVIRGGQPHYDPTPRIIQSIKLGSHPEPVRHADGNGTLKKAFSDLLEHLSKLPDCKVDIEVQHGLPFRLIVERPALNGQDNG